MSLVGPSQNTLDVMGCFEAHIEVNKRKVVERVYVVKGLQTPLIGRPAIQKLELVRRIHEVSQDKGYVISEYPELFTGLGKIKGRYQIELEEGAKPYSVSTPRRVPIPLLSRVKEELQRMENLGVISKIDQPTDWCSGMVVVPKPGNGVRICVDLTRLNKYVKRERHILPSVDQVLAQIGNAKAFSKLDANSGFWQIELDPESSKLTTFITPYGRYCFNRLPFGISSAPEFFQKRMSEILRGCEGVMGLIDDVLVHGRTEEEHHKRLIAVLEKLKTEGVTLNKDKCIFYTNVIHFLGQRVDQNGVSPDKEKIRAIQEIPRPTNITEIRRFLGMINQLSKFSPHLAERSKPIRDLLAKKNQWHWGPEQEKAFSDLKKDLGSAQTLALFEIGRESRVSADASSYGLGAVLRQRQPDGSWRPVTFVSRSMTPTEQRYAQIEKEALTLTWACDRLNQYLIGSKFTLETDHKPLIPLLSTKNLEDLPVRIQRFRLRMMRYQYDIIHVPGKDLNTADYLSRSPLHETGSDDLQKEVHAYIDLIFRYLPASDRRLAQIQQHQEKDPILKRWREEVSGGGRRRKSDNYNDLSICNGLLLKGNRIVIPDDLRNEVLEQLHTGHQGLVKCKERARVSVWWPGITKDIEAYIRKCKICCQFQQTKYEPLIPSELPANPWQKVGTDLFVWDNATYLLVVDYYSRFIEIAKLSRTTSQGVIDHLKSIFARHGIPQVVVSDNGPQYASSLFKDFANQYGFHHNTNSPRYPQANGEAERAVQTVKRLLLKSKDPYLALLSYRSTPLKIGYSPAELLMGRNLRSNLPTTQQQLKPHTPNQKKVRFKDLKIKESQKRYYDRRHRVKDMPPLRTGDGVWIPDQDIHGTVQAEHSTRSYTVRTPSGIIRRNRRDLNLYPVQNTSTLQHEESEDTSVIPPIQMDHEDQSEGTVIPSTLRRSSRTTHPPDRYGVWLNTVNQD